MNILKNLSFLFLTRLVVKNGDGTDCTGAVTYETEYALMTEDGVYILDIGKRIEKPSDTQTSYTEYFVQRRHFSLFQQCLCQQTYHLSGNEGSVTGWDVANADTRWLHDLQVFFGKPFPKMGSIG